MLLLVLPGCKMDTMFQVDTIVDIPLKPTEVTQPETEPMTEPVKVTEPFIMPDFNAGLENTTSQGDSTSRETQPPATERQTEAPTAPTVDVGAIYDISDHVPGTMEYEILTAVNAQRSAAELPELSLNRTLCGVASVRAYEASVNRSHARPDGRDGLSVLGDYGCETSASAEILYFTSVADSAERIVGIWMNSDRNRKHVLDEAYTSAGIGLYHAPDGVTYVAAIFVA